MTGKENITFRYPVTHHIMENYMEVMAHAEDPETKELLLATLDKARKEVIDAKEEVPEIQEYLKDENDTELIDLLMVKACENCVYDRYASTENDIVIESVTLDNFLLFQAATAVTLIGMVYHYCDPSIPSELYVELDDRWTGEDCTPELMLPIFSTMERVKDQNLLPGLEYIDWPDDLLSGLEKIMKEAEMMENTEESRQAVFEKFLENPYWKNYYDEAPSEECKEYIKWSFICSDEGEVPEEYEKQLKSAEENLYYSDFEYLIEHEENAMARSYFKKKLAKMIRDISI